MMTQTHILKLEEDADLPRQKRDYSRLLRSGFLALFLVVGSVSFLLYALSRRDWENSSMPDMNMTSKALVVTLDGSCGGTDGFSCIGFSDGSCCSQYGKTKSTVNDCDHLSPWTNFDF